MQVMKPHRGILIDKIPAKGPTGLIFAAGVVAIFLIGIPALRLFLAVTAPLGALVAGALYYLHNQTRW